MERVAFTTGMKGTLVKQDVGKFMLQLSLSVVCVSLCLNRRFWLTVCPDDSQNNECIFLKIENIKQA